MGAFETITPRLAARLVEDFGLTRLDCAALIGNLGHECEGFTTLQERKPVVKGSRGGYGWAQWTGPRRLQYEAWCARKGWTGDEFEANYSFLYRELTSTEKLALPRLKAAEGLEKKTEAFMKGFLRPGKPGLESRVRWARRALALIPETADPIPAPLPSPPAAPQGWLYKLLKRWRS